MSYNIEMENGDCICNVIANSGNEALNIAIQKYNYTYDEIKEVKLIK